jgi:cytochrome c553
MKNLLSLFVAGTLATVSILIATTTSANSSVIAKPITLAYTDDPDSGCNDGFFQEQVPLDENPTEGTPVFRRTRAPRATRTPTLTRTPENTRTPGATHTPEATRTAELTRTPEATETPRATATPCATRTPEPTPTAGDTRTPEPTRTSSPGTTPTPTRTPSGTATATPTAPVSSTTGRLLASNCFQCHGTDGRSSGGIEGIAGESASEIIGEMSEMSAGAIGNNIMKAHARSYTAEEIRLIAEYLATR